MSDLLSPAIGGIPIILSERVAEDQIVTIEGTTIFMHPYSGARAYSEDLIEQLRFIIRWRIQVALQKFDYRLQTSDSWPTEDR